MIKTTLATYLALNKITGMGPKHFFKLEKMFSDITQILSLTQQELKNQLSWNEKQLDAWKNISWAFIEQELTWATQPGCHIIHWHDPQYPRLLKEIASPPPILYVKGQLEALHRQIMALVGTRHPTEYGKKNAAHFSHHLAELGFCIASGLAIGIDGVAHQSALPFPAGTIAVTATGLDQIYPMRHQTLAKKIIENGAIISEFPFKTPPRAEHFPRRNRIISGLSRGVLVIEAALKSGSLITARYAMEQDREVFAIPGIIQNPQTQGCHALIRQGAVLVSKVDDILEELGLEVLPEKSAIPPTKTQPSPTSPLLQHLEHGIPIPVDVLVARSGLSPSAIAGELLMLEMDGVISKTPEGYYRN